MLRQKVAQIKENRNRSAPLPGGCAPYTCSEHFKLPSVGVKPKAKRWDHLFSADGVRQTMSTLKAAARLPSPVDVISLSIARPAPQYYPWESVTMQATNDPRSNADHDFASMTCSRGEVAYDLDVALNYGYAAGSPQTLRFITEHVEMIHHPPYEDWECSLTCGTTSALEIAFRLFCDCGDWIMAESHIYSGTVDSARSQGLNMMGIEMDGFGLLPDDLDSKLMNWDAAKGRKPRLLYTIPTGQNPTGFTQSVERRKAVYQVAEKHDLYILEDDPYFYLQLGGYRPKTDEAVSSTENLADAYLGQLPPSYLSLDRSGRVLRMDTTSKVISPGLRCGWVSGCAQVIDKFLKHTELGVLAVSGPTQFMLYKLLDETWGHEGFIMWLARLSLQYQERLNILDKACRHHLPTDICSWNKPTEGMFLWIKINWSRHPGYVASDDGEAIKKFCRDLEDRVYNKARSNGVIISKGSWFAVDDQYATDMHFRLTFAAAPLDMLEEAVKRFAGAIRSEFTITETTTHDEKLAQYSVTEILEPHSLVPSETGVPQG